MTPLAVAAASLLGLALVLGWLRLVAAGGRARSRVEVELDRVRAASQLLAQVQGHLDGRSLPGTTEELLHEVRGWLAGRVATGPAAGCVVEPDVIALRSGDHAERNWAVLGADDVVRASSCHELPAALLRADTGLAVVLVPDVTPGDGLDPRSRRAAYLWLGNSGGVVAVLALEWGRPGRFAADEMRALGTLRVLLEELSAAVVRLHRLRDDAQEGERQRLAAQLHDSLGQDLAYLAVELSRAGQRHPDDEELAQLTTAFRDALAVVRTTIGQLRRAEPVLVATPARRVAEALAPDVPCRVIADGVSEPHDRAREDTVVACVAAIVASVADRRPSVTIRGTSRTASEVLEVRIDGATVDVQQPGVGAAIAAGERAGVVVDVQGRPSGTWVIVRSASPVAEAERRTLPVAEEVS